ncbi:acyl-CoA thioesterase II [Blastococcus sp. URHD0036]|uniref:acyl-CoA thioesterase n=1 Tax=Blastococcus sp. URHD0036 TaxID=1380356 RepID=UPI0004968659|nr:acyl-CoA thioesterase II [Blastococcus sp. URHD0036]
MTDILDVLTVERLDADLYRGHPVPTRMARTFGGQVAGQSMMAAVATVDPAQQVHSLHGYFIRPGRPAEPILLLVDRVRTGRGFSTRRVSAVQDGETIFTMSASFHAGDDGPEHQELAPPVPRPEEVPQGDPLDGHFAAEWPNWDAVWVPEPEGERIEGRPRQLLWVRYRHRLPDDPAVHVGALTYLSDMHLLGTSMQLHGRAMDLQFASLDHALWFHRPFRADEWLLYDQISPSAAHGRSYNRGQITDLRGRLVASVVQEGLMRTPRTGQPPAPPA